jgi:hypothetical protein
MKGAKIGYVVVYHIDGCVDGWHIVDDNRLGIMTKKQAKRNLSDLKLTSSTHPPKTYYGVVRLTFVPELSMPEATSDNGPCSSNEPGTAATFQTSASCCRGERFFRWFDQVVLGIRP